MLVLNADSYRYIHNRLLPKSRGRAAEHECSDCGGPANSWSINWREVPESEYAWEFYQSRWVPVSSNPWHYSPRCGPCHNAYDR